MATKDVKEYKWPGNTQNNPRYYPNASEAAAYLGMTEDQLMQHKEQGAIAALGSRGSWRFKQDEIARFKQALNATPIQVGINEINDDVLRCSPFDREYETSVERLLAKRNAAARQCPDSL